MSEDDQKKDIEVHRPDVVKMLEDYLEAYNNGGLSDLKFRQYWHYYSIQIIRFYSDLIAKFEAAQAEGVSADNTISMLGETVTLNKQTDLPILDENSTQYEITRKTASTEEKFSITEVGKDPSDIEDMFFPPTLTVAVTSEPKINYRLIFKSTATQTQDHRGVLKIDSLEKTSGGQTVRVSTALFISHPPDPTSIPLLS